MRSASRRVLCRWLAGVGRLAWWGGGERGEISLGQRAVEVSAGHSGHLAAGTGKIAQEGFLEIYAGGLPGEADGAASEGDVVARLDAVQVFEEPAAAGVHGLTKVLRFHQTQGARLL